MFQQCVSFKNYIKITLYTPLSKFIKYTSSIIIITVVYVAPLHGSLLRSTPLPKQDIAMYWSIYIAFLSA